MFDARGLHFDTSRSGALSQTGWSDQNDWQHIPDIPFGFLSSFPDRPVTIHEPSVCAIPDIADSTHTADCALAELSGISRKRNDPSTSHLWSERSSYLRRFGNSL